MPLPFHILCICSVCTIQKNIFPVNAEKQVILKCSHAVNWFSFKYVGWMQQHREPGVPDVSFYRVWFKLFVIDVLQSVSRMQLQRLQKWRGLQSDFSVLGGSGCASCLHHPVWGLCPWSDSVDHLEQWSQFNSCLFAACYGGVQVYSGLVRSWQSYQC